MEETVKTFINFAAKEEFLEEERGGWCVRCALGNAKSHFDREYHRRGVPLGDVLAQFATNTYVERDGDYPLPQARDFLASKNFDMLFQTKKEAISFMKESLTN